MYRQTYSPKLNKNEDQRVSQLNGFTQQPSECSLEWDQCSSANILPTSDVCVVVANLDVVYTNESFVPDVEQIETFNPLANHSASELPEQKFENYISCLRNTIFKVKRNATHWMELHRKHIRRFLKIIVFLLYNIYLGFAVKITWSETASWCEGIKFLVIITSIVYFCMLYSMVLCPFCLRPLIKRVSSLWGSKKPSTNQYITKIAWVLTWLCVLIFLCFDTRRDRRRLISALGLVILIIIGFIFSTHPRKVSWRQVQWGILMQFIIGLLCLRWSVGKEIFQCLGDKVKIFLDFTNSGSAFVFGYLVTGNLDGAPAQAAVFAFKVLSVIIFFSFFISLLYYYGVMQMLVLKVGWLLQATIGTTACESMNSAGNIFLGMTESPLMIRPYLPLLTKSELHTVLTSGFATIAGSVLAAYVNFGVNASHLLSASIMSAPAAIAYSKLTYPEVEKSRTQVEDIKIDKGTETTALEAATNGASIAISLVTNIAANLIAFIAFISFMDGMFAWFGSLIKCDFFSFEWLMGKLFIPLSLIMGVDWEDKERVANLVGLKTVVNEFVAYFKLSQYKAESQLSARSEAIATFALCGFSNISSIGIQVGALSAMAPERKSDLSALAVRAMISGSIACFMTACVAGTLLDVDAEYNFTGNRTALR